MNANIEPQVINKPEFIVVGVKYHGRNDNDEIRALWAEFSERMDEVPHRSASGHAIGLIDSYDPATGEFDYMAGVEVDRVEELPEGMNEWTVLAQNYAVFPTTLETLQETYRQRHEQWLPQSPYRRTPGPEFELYDEQFDPHDPSSPMYLYYPVEPLSGGE